MGSVCHEAAVMLRSPAPLRPVGRSAVTRDLRQSVQALCARIGPMGLGGFGMIFLRKVIPAARIALNTECVSRHSGQAFRARPKRRHPPKDRGTRSVVAANVPERDCDAGAPNRKGVADFTYVWTAAGWLCGAAVVDLFSRRVVGWPLSADLALPKRLSSNA